MRVSAGVAGLAASLLVVGLVAAVPLARAAAAAAGSAQPSTLYVAGDSQAQPCSNSGPGTEQYPLCTIQYAASVVQPGQTVMLEPSPYAPGEAAVVSDTPVTITRSGTPAAPITFESETSGFGNFAAIYTLGAPALTLTGVHDVVFKSMEFQYYPSSSEPGITQDAVVVAGSHDVTFEDDNLEGITIDGQSSGITVSQSQAYGVAAAPGASQITVTTSMIDGPVALSGVDGADITSNTVRAYCVSPLSIAGGSSGGSTAVTAENNVLIGTTDNQCPANLQGAALSVDAASAPGVHADYNGLSAQAPGTDYSWSGMAYANPADFAQGTGQGAHDVAAPQLALGDDTPPEGSILIDSADCAAPAELSTDVYGNPHADDPNVANTGSGTCHADRGAVELEDDVTPAFTTSPSTAAGVAPFTFGVTVTSAATSSQWKQPVSYTVSFGDGSAPVPATPGVAATHTYPTPGRYTLTVTGGEPGGSALSATRQVTVLTPQPAKVTLTGRENVVSGGPNPIVVADEATFDMNAGPDYWEITGATLSYGDGGQGWPYPTNPAVVHDYARPGTYRATLTETDLLGRKSVAAVVVTVGDLVSPRYVDQMYSRTLAPHAVAKFSDALFLRPQEDRAAFVVVSVTSPKEAGYVTVYPDGTARPGLATVQFRAGQSVSNTAIATPGQKGEFDVYNGSSAATAITITIVGTEGAGDSFGFTPVHPVSVLAKTKIAGNHSATFTVSGRTGLPGQTDEVILDVTATATAAAGHFTLVGSDRGAYGTVPGACWAKGQAVTGLVMLPLNTSRAILSNVSSGAAYFSAQLVGYFAGSGTGSVFVPQPAATRVLNVKVAGRHGVKVMVAGKNGVPTSGTTAVQVNLTASGATAPGAITAYPDGTTLPANLISLSYTAGQSDANAAIVAVGKDGAIDLYNVGSKPVTLTVDLTGSYYAY
jgi:hypothetical protein